MASRKRDGGSEGSTESPAILATACEGALERAELTPPSRGAEVRLCEPPEDSGTALTEAERSAIQAQRIRLQEHRDRVHEKLRLDAQACAKAMQFSPVLDDAADPKTFEGVAAKALADYRSGTALMDQLGAARLLDPALTGMLLSIRRGLIEETGAATASEMMLIDMAIVAYANAMRVQSMVGNTALLIEAEMFGQPSLRTTMWRELAGMPDKIRGLEVDHHVALLRDQVMPLVERFHGLGRKSIEALARVRQWPSDRVERAGALKVALI
jgi:hypothetical protein